jgi:hypothetical protein
VARAVGCCRRRRVVAQQNVKRLTSSGLDDRDAADVAAAFVTAAAGAQAPRRAAQRA